MKSKLRSFFIFVGVFILCFIKTYNVNALNINVSDVKLTNKNASAKVGDTSLKNNTINSKLVLNKVGSYAEYEIILDNNESTKYTIRNITNNLKNKNIKISYNSEELKANDKAKLNIKIKYDKKIEESIKNKNLGLTLNLKEEDNILLYFICLISATVGIIFIITTRKHKNLRLIVATLTVVPILVLLYWSLSTEKYDVKLDNITVIGYSKTARTSGDGISSFKVNIDLGDGSEPIEKIVDYGDKIGELPEIPDKDGYEKDGWEDDHGNPVTEDTEVTEEMYIEPKYKPIEYKISYELNGGENNIDNPITYTTDTKDFELKDPIRSTYTFTGWTGSNGEEIQRTVTIKSGSKGNLKYEAHYTKSADKLNVTLSNTEYIYTGDEIRPEVVVKDGNTTLKEKVDYNLEYKNNINTGKADVVITMIDKYNDKTDATYEGSTTKNFTINKATPTVTIIDKKYTYTGKNITLDTKEAIVNPNSGGQVTIKYYSDSKLKNEVTKIVDAGTYYYRAEVSETKNYSKAYSTVKKIIVERKGVELPIQDSNEVFTYNAKEQVLRENTEYYTVSGDTKGTNAGTYNITVTPTENYKWEDGTTSSKTITVKIKPYNISNAYVSNIDEVTYNGENYTPTPDVVVPLPSVDNPTTLTNNDRIYSYSSNKNAGTATVTITGKGNYTGTTSQTFTINKAEGYITLSESSKTINYGTNNVSFDITSNHGGTLEVTTNNNQVSATINNGRVNVTNLSSIGASGSVIVTVKCNENINYLSATSTYTISVDKGTPTVTLNNKTVEYTGNNITVNDVIVTPNSGGAVTVKYYSDSELQDEVTPKDAGTYYMKATVAATDNYTEASSGVATLTITRKRIAVPTLGTYTYNGQEQTFLTDTDQYTVSGDKKGTNARTYNVHVTPTSNYRWNDDSTRSKTVVATINPYNLSNSTIGLISNETYNGENHTPTPNVSVPLPSADNPTTLTSGEISYSYSNNKNAGTATVTVTGYGNYTGTKSKQFTIDKANGHVTLSHYSSQISFGTDSVSFEITDTHGGDIELAINKDNLNVSRSGSTVTVTGLYLLESGTSATVTVTSKATTNYNSASSNYIITSGQATPEITLADQTREYTGNNITVDTSLVTVTPETEGTVSIKYYSDSELHNEVTPKNVGTYYMKASVTETTNYVSASTVATLTITRKAIAVPTQTNTLTYNGTEQTLMTSTSQYTVSGTTKGTNAGSYNVTVTPTSNYKWSDNTTTGKTVSITIGKYDLSSATLSPIEDVTYNNDEQKPTPSVSVPLPSVDNPTTLTSSDITYSYSDNINAGTATVTVTGKGNYKGTKSENFTINKAQGFVTLDVTNYQEVLEGTEEFVFNFVDASVLDFEFRTTRCSATINSTGIHVTGLSSLAVGDYAEVIVVSKESRNYTEGMEFVRIYPVHESFTGGTVHIMGRNVVGETLTASVSDTTPVADSYTYQWYSTSNNLIGNSTKISGATSSTYTVQESDVGNVIYVIVTAHKTGYNDKTFQDNTTNLDNAVANSSKKATIPTSAYCKNVTYTGGSQTLTIAASEGFSFADNSGIAAGDYTVVAHLNSNYIWSDYSTTSKTFTCSINKSNTTTYLSDIETVYDGDPKPASGATAKLNSNNSSISGSYTYTYYNGNTCSGSALSSAPSSAGLYSVKATLTGTSNYNSSTSSCAKLDIIKTDIVCTASSSSKTYDGTELTANGGTCTGLSEGETATVTASGSVTNVSDSATGNNPISKVTIKNSQNEDITSTYSIVKKPGTLTIVPKGITCTATSTSKTYDGTPLTANSGSCSNLVSGQTATVTTTGSITNVSQTANGNNPVDSVVIKKGTTDVTNNYTINKVAGKLTINPKSITCTSSSSSKTYDGTALTATGGTCTGLISGHSSTFVNTGSSTTAYRMIGDVNEDGVINDDDVTVIQQYLANWDVSMNYTNADVNEDGVVDLKDGLLLEQYIANWNINMPVYGDTDNTISSVTIKSGSTDVSSNYSITKVPGKLHILPKSISITATNQSKEYDGTELTANSQCTITSGSLLSGETYSCVGTGSQTIYGSNRKKLTTVTIMKGSNNVSNNYNVNRINGSISITKRAITVKADNQSKTYNGSALSADNTCSVTSGTLPSGHTITCTTSGSITNVGSTTKTLTDTSIKNSNGISVDSSFVVTKQNGTLTVSAKKDATTGSCESGLVYNKDSQTLASGATNATYSDNSAISAGSHTVTVTANANHAFSDGTTSKTLNCSIGKKSLTITAANKSMTYGGSAPTYSYTLSGVVSGDTAVSGTAKYTIKNGSTTVSNVSSANVGSYTIVPSGLTINSNYTASYSNGTLTINRASVTEPSCTDTTYNGSTQTLLAAKTSGAYTNSAITGKNAGDYSTTLTLNSNYQWSSGSSVTSNRTKTCTIKQKSIEIIPDDRTITYGDSEPTYSYSVTGAISGETAVTGQVTYRIYDQQVLEQYVNIPKLDVGTYKIIAYGYTVNSNYNAIGRAGTLTINKKTPSLTIGGSPITSLDTGGSNGTITVKPSVSGTLEVTSAGTGCAYINSLTSSPKAVTANTTYSFNYNAKGPGDGCVYTYKLTPTSSNYAVTASPGRINKTYGYWILDGTTNYKFTDTQTPTIARFNIGELDSSNTSFKMTCTVTGNATYIDYILINGNNNGEQVSNNVYRLTRSTLSNAYLTIFYKATPPTSGTTVTLTCSPENAYYHSKTVSIVIKP